MKDAVKVACIQAEPVVLDRDATIEKLAALAAEAAGEGAQLLVFPEAFIPAYPSSVWASALAGWADAAARRRPSRTSRASPSRSRARPPTGSARSRGSTASGSSPASPSSTRSGPATLYNTLLYHAPGRIARAHHRKLVPTNHERLVWGQGDGRGLRAIETPIGRLGGLICWENYMPLARFALYESGVEIYIASTADDGDAWQSTLVHIARESRAFVVAPSHFQRAAPYPADFPLAELLEGST